MRISKLQELRTMLQLSQEEISKQTGISYRAYTSYERGDRKPSFEFLAKIAKIYNVNLNWIIANEGEMFVRDTKQQSLKQEIISEVRAMLQSEGVLKRA